MVIFSALGSVFSIAIMVAIGYYLTAKRWFDSEVAGLFSKLVVNVSLPLLMFYNLVGNFDRSKLSHLAKGLIIPFLSIGICYLIGVLVAKVLNIDEKRRGTFESMFFASNAIFIGLPVNLALFGDDSVPYVLLYYIANTLFFWSLGAYCISKDGMEKGTVKMFSFDTVKRIFSPPLFGFMGAIVIILLNIYIPKFVLDSCRYIGNLTTPLSMFYIGITMYYVKFSEIKPDKDMFGVILGRFIVSPLVVFLLAFYFPVDPLMKNVFIIQSAMPVVTSTAIVARIYNADNKYAAVMTVVTTIASIFFIPVYMVLLS
jgi:malate permease and related proteins